MNAEPLTHIAAVASIRDEWAVCAVYPRGTEGLEKLHPGYWWMFVPATCPVGCTVLPPCTVYADPEYAEYWAGRPV